MTRARVMLKCGCTAYATTGDGKPSCVVHDCTEVAEAAPNLAGRVARCTYRGCRGRRTGPADPRIGSSFYGELRDGEDRAVMPSDAPGHGPPFFSHKPDKAEDEFYCGCFGWD